jgi:hypothetical protein
VHVPQLLSSRLFLVAALLNCRPVVSGSGGSHGEQVRAWLCLMGGLE